MRVTVQQLRQLIREIWIKPSAGGYEEKLGQLGHEQADELARSLGYEGDYTADVEKYEAGGPRFEAWIDPDILASIGTVQDAQIKIELDRTMGVEVLDATNPRFALVEGEELYNAVEQLVQKDKEAEYDGDWTEEHTKAWNKLIDMIFGMARSINIDEYTLEDLGLADIGRPDLDGVVEISGLNPMFKKYYDMGKVNFIIDLPHVPGDSTSYRAKVKVI